MTAIHTAIENARNEYEYWQDLFERGECSRRDVIHAERRLNELRWERDTYRPQPQVEWATEYEAILDTVYA